MGSKTFSLLILVVSSQTLARDLAATPSLVNALLPQLVAGDTLTLAPGTYTHLTLNGLTGTPSGWITITGPSSGAPAIIEADAQPCCNTVEIVNSSYVAIRHLRIDNKGVKGAFAISAKQGVVHHIRIENNELVFTNADQNDCGISTKIQTWGWEIRGNRIDGAGTGLYLGNSDGSKPFVEGLIENNLVTNPVGYDMEIKHQIAWPTGTGLPQGETATVIRHNVFIKNDGPSPAGNRPNVLFDGFPDTGPGASNRYEVYGNVFFHNPREALVQASGNFSIHDNLFVDSNSPAIVVMNHAGKVVKRAMIFNNTILTAGTGVSFANAATVEDFVVGNLVFAGTPFSGPIAYQRDNLTAPVAMAAQYVRAPSMSLPGFDLLPRGQAVEGSPLDLSAVRSEQAAQVDFDGRPKGTLTFRGAYATADSSSCGWVPRVANKPAALCAGTDGGTGPFDAGALDAGAFDAGPHDAGAVDASTGDSGAPGATPSDDGGTVEADAPIVGGCGCESTSAAGLAGCLLVAARRRRQR